jgi:hypothetical protein
VLARIDKSVAAGVSAVLRHPGAEQLELVFAVDRTTPDGRVVSIPLVDGGVTMAVTDENKHAYAAALVDWHLDAGIAVQATRLLVAFRGVLPPDIDLHELSPVEVGGILTGSPNLDLAAWRQHTVYENG